MDEPNTSQQRLEQVLEATVLLHSSLDLPVILQRLMDAAMGLVNADACAIFLAGREGGELRLEGARGFEGQPPAIAPQARGVAGWVMEHGEPLLIADISQDERFHFSVDSSDQFQIRPVLAVPLEAGGETRGVLAVCNGQGSAPFSGEDAGALTWLARHGALAIENARASRQADQVSDVVHELRTPLTSVVGYSKMLLMGEGLDPATQRQFLETVHREATRMGTLVNDILELSRLESGRIRLAQEPVPLHTVVGGAVSMLQPQAREKDLAVRVDLPEPSPVVTGDRERLGRVFLNLLNNAIKYNRPGGWVEVRGRTRPGGQVAVAVADSGRGIAAEYFPRLFEKFFRLEEEGGAKGSGLGLAYARQVVEAHGGRIEVQSEPGQGSTFTVILPVRG